MKKKDNRIKIIGLGQSGSIVANCLNKQGCKYHVVAIASAYFITYNDFEYDTTMVVTTGGEWKSGKDIDGELILGSLESGRVAFEANKDKIINLLDDSEIVILTAGLGGGCGTIFTSEIARLAYNMNKKVYVVVSTAGKFEGNKTNMKSKSALNKLLDMRNKNILEDLIVIDIDELGSTLSPKCGLLDFFKKVDYEAVDIINSIIQKIEGNSK